MFIKICLLSILLSTLSFSNNIKINIQINTNEKSEKEIISAIYNILKLEKIQVKILKEVSKEFKLEKVPLNCKININKAPLSELVKIKGIGPKLAGTILQRRKLAHFTKLSQIKLIKGIGPKKYEAICKCIVLK